MIKSSNHLRELPVGSKGYVVGYDRAWGGYQGTLITMGLLPGVEFEVLRNSNSCEFVAIKVEELIILLNKPEVNALCVEEVNSE
jgi:ferrous iron transport protein A